MAATTLVVLWLAGALVGLDPGRVDGSVLATATRIVVLGGSVAGVVLVLGRISAAPRGGAGAVPGTAAAAPASSDPGSAPGDGTTRSGPSARRRDATRSGRPAPAGRLRGVFLAGTAALVLCAASPYLGWRAGDAFTMYSGLRTSPSGWNHVLLPSAVRLRD